MKGVTFGSYHSYDDFSLILSQKTIGTPSPKTNVIDIPGGDGVLDYTEYFGDVRYNNRMLTFEFSKAVSQAEFLTLLSDVQDALHGKKLNITLDDDPGYFYSGRINVAEWKNERNIGHMSIECDCDPWKYKASETVSSGTVSGSATVILTNSRKKVVPIITASASMTFRFNNVSYAASAGTFQIPQLELSEGNNTIIISGNGTVSFRYREGGL